MKKTRGWVDEGAVELPEPRRHGTYPPDIARRRRQLGLPVTPEEHAAYGRGEMREPPVTVAQMAQTLRDVLPRCAPGVAHALRKIATRCAWRTRAHEAGGPPREPGGDDDTED